MRHLRYTMNNLKALTRVAGMLCLVALLASCNEDARIRFKDPQPVDAEPQSAFYGDVLGRWMSLEDSSVLVVTPEAIVRQDPVVSKIAIKEIGDSVSVTVKGDSYYMNDTILLGRRLGADSIALVIAGPDTIFSIGPDHILKYQKKQWFLNDRKETGFLVRRLTQVKKDILSYDQLDYNADGSKIKEATDVSTVLEDSTEMISAQPSAKQFRRFLRKDGFAKRERFVRIK